MATNFIIRPHTGGSQSPTENLYLLLSASSRAIKTASGVLFIKNADAHLEVKIIKQVNVWSNVQFI